MTEGNKNRLKKLTLRLREQKYLTVLCVCVCVTGGTKKIGSVKLCAELSLHLGRERREQALALGAPAAAE